MATTPPVNDNPYATLALTGTPRNIYGSFSLPADPLPLAPHSIVLSRLPPLPTVVAPPTHSPGSWGMLLFRGVLGCLASVVGFCLYLAGFLLVEVPIFALLLVCVALEAVIFLSTSIPVWRTPIGPTRHLVTWNAAKVWNPGWNNVQRRCEDLWDWVQRPPTSIQLLPTAGRQSSRPPLPPRNSQRPPTGPLVPLLSLPFHLDTSDGDTNRGVLTQTTASMQTPPPPQSPSFRPILSSSSSSSSSSASSSSASSPAADDLVSVCKSIIARIPKDATPMQQGSEDVITLNTLIQTTTPQGDLIALVQSLTPDELDTLWPNLHASRQDILLDLPEPTKTQITACADRFMASAAKRPKPEHIAYMRAAEINHQALGRCLGLQPPPSDE